jgi:predicted lipoprotein with Yx(FWY)xxD motif
MKKLLIISAFVLAGCSTFGSASANEPVSKNGMLLDKAGMTLYTFDKDTANSGKSACNGPCAANWPPLAADKNASAKGEYTIITRDDGTRQWAHEGKPLYHFKSDQKPGDRTGDNVKNVWHAAKD